MALTNFGFAPGGSPNPATPSHAGQQARIRAMVVRLPDTELIETGDTVHDFIDGIRIDSAIDKPIGNALIGGHADSEGNFFISMFADQENTVDGIDEGQTNWEVLDATIKANHPERSINMDEIIDNSGNHFVHFKGCNLGKVTKFMNKFKAVMDADHVTAPAHFHGLNWQPDAGVYEHMAYEFKVFKQEPFTDRDDLIDAFKAGGFTLIDRSPVPPERWAEWVPANIKKKKVTTITFRLGQLAGGRRTLKADREFRVESTKKHAYQNIIGPFDPFPPKADWEGIIFDDIKKAPEFQKNHPFPFYERWGYADAPGFIAGLKWSFKRGTKKDKDNLIGTGVRSQYTVLVPIVDLTDGHLFFNFHPHAAVTQVTQIREDDPRFFGIF